MEALIFYEADRQHFATLSISQKNDDYPYLVDVEAFATFEIDRDGCREAYKNAFRPDVVGVNVARILFASVRDMVATVSARFPYESARIPTLLLEPSDVKLHFEGGAEEQILIESFGVDPELVRKAREEAELEVQIVREPKKPRRPKATKTA